MDSTNNYNTNAPGGYENTNAPSGNRNATTGFNDPEGTHGPHHSAVGNAMDPRVDSDRDNVNTSRGPTTDDKSGYPTDTKSTSDANNPVEPHSGQGGGFVETVKGRVAQVHGIGESARGHFNSTMSNLLHDDKGREKNAKIIAGGEREFANKEFERHGTTDKAL